MSYKEIDVTLHKVLYGGFTVGLEVRDGMDSIELHETTDETIKPKEAIDSAIQVLNEVIKKLEALKKTKSPTKSDTQDKVNGKRRF